MSYIKADYDRLEQTSKSVQDYAAGVKKKMEQASDEIAGLSSAWSGSDYNNFKLQWDKAAGSDSAYSKIINFLDSYSKLLSFASLKYKEAQTRAVNCADNLLWW